MSSSAAEIPMSEAAPAPRVSRKTLATSLAVFAFLNSWLLFSLEPMASKLLLPRLGGTPAVWTTCLLFFQAALLAGYAYAHVSLRYLGTKRQAALHAGVLALSLLFLPVSLASGAPPAGDSGVAWLLGLLTTSIGVPFMVLASGAPLAQRWLADAGGEGGRDPYYLYAASNLGSLLALISYPFLVEPLLALRQQATVWSASYVALSAFAAAIAWRVRALASRSVTTAFATAGDSAAGDNVSWRDRARWLLYAAVPSSMLMGSTSYISTDIAAFPLIWVLPLSLYLLTFVVVFSRRPALPHWLMLRAEPHLLVVAALTLFWALRLPVAMSVVFHLLLLFVVAMVCHGELARTRPRAHSLTEFYLWIAVGGLMGGAFNALAAPLLFDDIREYPLAIVAAALLRPSVARGSRPVDVIAPLGFGAFLLAATWRGGIPPAVFPTIILFAMGLALFMFRDRPVRFALALVVTFAIGNARLASKPSGRDVIEKRRSFFGVYRVFQDPAGRVRMIEHGSTLHGAQAIGGDLRLTPLSYYHPSGPAGDIFSRTLPSSLDLRRVGVVGLGAGSLSCYGRAGEKWTYYEIDPLVAAIAADPRHFTFLRDCPPSSRVVFGDARLTLQEVPAASYDILVIDAFSSDAIPLHLMTREAVTDYLRVLSPAGVLAIHISNKHMDLEPVLAAIAASGRYSSLARHDSFKYEGVGTPIDRSPSLWVVMARDSGAFGLLRSDVEWQPLRRKAGVTAWTDDFSNVLSVIRWK